MNDGKNMSSSMVSSSMENHPIYILIDELKSTDVERKKHVSKIKLIISKLHLW